MRIVLAFDGSPAAEEAVERLLDRRDNTSVVRILGVVDVRVPWWIGIAFSPPEVTEALDACAAETRERIEGAARAVALRLSDAGIPCHVAIVEGCAERTILDAAASWNADVIAIGAGEHRRLLRSPTIGHVAREVVRRSRCPVLLARPHAR
jgi:nucleotide-binding universal stress UspA family protein